MIRFLTDPMVLIILAVSSACGVLLGVIDAGDNRERGGVGCEYHSILGYFPARVIGCELVKKRW